MTHLACSSCPTCPANCKQCSSSSTCTKCKTPYALYQSECLGSCPDATFISTAICIGKVIFSVWTWLFLKGCPSGCSSCTSNETCQTCDQGYLLSNSLCVESFSSSPSSSQKTQEKATQAISSSAQGIGSVVCVGSATFPLTAVVSKTVQNTRYLNISVTVDLAEIYQTWDTGMISWQPPNVLSGEGHFKTSPSVFARYELGSPFLANFWPTLLTIAIGFTAFIICIVVQKSFERVKYEGWAYSLFQKLVAGSFNFALAQAFTCLDDILFYLVIDIKTNPFNSFFSWASFICALIFLVAGCSLVFFNFWTANKYQDLKSQGLAKKNMKDLDAFNERNKYCELFYSDFNDDDMWSQSFFALLIIRSALSSLIITVFYDYPLMQTTFLVMLDGAMILLLYFKKPFKTIEATLCQYYFEIITFLVHICTFILSLQDSFKMHSDTLRLILSSAIIYLNTALISGSIGFMFVEICKTIRKKIKTNKLKKLQKIPEDNQESQHLTLTANPVQSSEDNAQRGQNRIHREKIGNLSDRNFYLHQVNKQDRNISMSGLNMESSQIQESNFNVDDSAFSDIIQQNRILQQRRQSTRPIFVQSRPRIIRPSPQRNRSIITSHINNTPIDFGNI